MPMTHEMVFLLCKKAWGFTQSMNLLDGVELGVWANLASGIQDDIEGIRLKMSLLFASIEFDWEFFYACSFFQLRFLLAWFIDHHAASHRCLDNVLRFKLMRCDMRKLSRGLQHNRLPTSISVPCLNSWFMLCLQYKHRSLTSLADFVMLFPDS